MSSTGCCCPTSAGLDKFGRMAGAGSFPFRHTEDRAETGSREADNPDHIYGDLDTPIGSGVIEHRGDIDVARGEVVV